MNIDYLMSILELYKTKEIDRSTNLCFTKYINNKIRVDFKMNNIDSPDATSFFMEYDTLMDDTNLKNVLNNYKQGNIIIDEKYEYDKLHETCYYYALFNNSRNISFKNFKLEEINHIRNLMYNVNFNLNEITINDNEEEKSGYYQSFRLSEAGFTGFLSMAFIALLLFNVLIIALWIFKNFI